MDIIKEMRADLSWEERANMFSYIKQSSLKQGITLEHCLKKMNVFSLEDFLDEVEYYSVCAPTSEISDTLEREAFKLCKLVLNYRKFRGML